MRYVNDYMQVLGSDFQTRDSAPQLSWNLPLASLKSIGPDHAIVFTWARLQFRTPSAISNDLNFDQEMLCARRSGKGRRSITKQYTIRKTNKLLFI